MDIRKGLDQVFTEYLEERQTQPLLKSAARFDSKDSGIVARSKNMAKGSTIFSESLGSSLAPLYQAHDLIRPRYGKFTRKEPTFGDHPDFVHLRSTDNTEYCPITTLFMDIVNSTKLGLLFAPEDVRRIKNALICSALEVITSFDGHPARLMGDAVLAFFGGKHTTPEQGAIDAINCAAMLNYLMNHVALPKLASDGYGNDLGVRMGLDYGPRDKVLWSAYGYPTLGEVTATSFYVDVASKLQHSAGSNQVMIGQSLKEFVDFPDDLLSIKTVERDGARVKEPILQPNHRGRDGVPIDYKQYLLKVDPFLRVSPLAQQEMSTNSGMPINVDLEVRTLGGDRLNKYFACSSFIAKHRSILFDPQIPSFLLPPYKVRYSVENHGAEAEAAGCLRHFSEVSVNTLGGSAAGTQTTLYRGLHYMTIEVIKDSNRVYQTTAGILVE